MSDPTKSDPTKTQFGNILTLQQLDKTKAITKSFSDVVDLETAEDLTIFICALASGLLAAYGQAEDNLCTDDTDKIRHAIANLLGKTLVR